MKKVDIKFVERSYKGAISNYSDAVDGVGLWKSEEYVLDKYFDKDKSILDIGCGAGRTTFGLYQKGYKDIVGLDLNKDMIRAAKKIDKEKGYGLNFTVGNVLNLDFDDNSFDYALFSFNGITQIPSREGRVKVLEEIRRVLKDDGIFIFTTYDRDMGEEYREFWKKEKERWERGEQDKRLYEYGDRITTSKNEKGEIFIHIPDREEVLESLAKAGFELVEDFYRSDLFDEKDKVKELSGECMFWVVNK
ncbi:class I SAM-dependent methyltransferase [Halonatronum saccharophilum]|uniref:class I SAM-dependent methyltransferase n=1 Tax=Halonatronum saccharophilum TaxID=150060 RepID=UPI0004823E82|nr:class I SAM-dependent methyltransferase [Halonatronum saccharophilum]